MARRKKIFFTKRGVWCTPPQQSLTPQQKQFLVQGVSGFPTSQLVLTTTINVPAGSLLVLSVSTLNIASSDPTQTLSIADSLGAGFSRVDTYKRISESAYSGSLNAYLCTSQWFAQNVAAGQHTVTITGVPAFPSPNSTVQAAAILSGFQAVAQTGQPGTDRQDSWTTQTAQPGGIAHSDGDLTVAQFSSLAPPLAIDTSMTQTAQQPPSASSGLALLVATLFPTTITPNPVYTSLGPSHWTACSTIVEYHHS